MQTHTETTLHRVVQRPPVLRATRELGIRDRDLCRVLGVTPGQMGDWAQGTKRIPPVRHVALVTAIATLRDQLAALPVPEKHARLHAAALKSVQDWLDLAAQEAEAYSPEDIEKGSALGLVLLEKLGIEP